MLQEETESKQKLREQQTIHWSRVTEDNGR